MAVHHAVGISRQRNSGYSPSMVNIMAQDLSTPDPSLSPRNTPFDKEKSRNNYTTHTHIMVSRNTTLVSSLGLRFGPAGKAGLSAGMRRERVPPQRRQKENPLNICKTNRARKLKFSTLV